MSANAIIKPGRELERVGRALHAGALRFPNLSTSGLRDLATLARWLAAMFDAKVEARSAPFPASLPPWLVMQWLPLREVAAALRVASWWRGESEQYFRQFAQYHGLIRVDSWQESVECYMELYRDRSFTVLQENVFHYYAKHWAKEASRVIPIDEAVVVGICRIKIDPVQQASVDLFLFLRVEPFVFVAVKLLEYGDRDVAFASMGTRTELLLGSGRLQRALHFDFPVAHRLPARDGQGDPAGVGAGVFFWRTDGDTKTAQTRLLDDDGDLMAADKRTALETIVDKRG